MLPLPLVRFTRKSVRQTFWIGVAFLATSTMWLIGSLSVGPHLVGDENVKTGIILLPFVMLMIAAIGFLGAWAQYVFYSWIGLTGPDDDN
jgi:hypothetical protein